MIKKIKLSVALFIICSTSYILAQSPEAVLDEEVTLMPVVSSINLEVSADIIEDQVYIAHYTREAIDNPSEIQFIFWDDNGAKIAHQTFSSQSIRANELYEQSFQILPFPARAEVKVLNNAQQTIARGSVEFDLEGLNLADTTSKIVAYAPVITETDSVLSIEGVLESLRFSGDAEVHLTKRFTDNGSVETVKKMVNFSTEGQKRPYDFQFALSELPSGVYEYEIKAMDLSGNVISPTQADRFFVPGIFLNMNSAISEFNDNLNRFDIQIKGRTNQDGVLQWELIEAGKNIDKGTTERDLVGVFEIELEGIDLTNPDTRLRVSSTTDLLFDKALKDFVSQNELELSLEGFLDIIEAFDDTEVLPDNSEGSIFSEEQRGINNLSSQGKPVPNAQQNVTHTLVIWGGSLLILVLLLICLLFLRNKFNKSKFMLWFLGFILSNVFVATTLAQTPSPVVGWNHPVGQPVWSFTTSGNSEFRFMPVAGEVYDAVTFQDFFPSGGVSTNDIRINIRKSSTVRQYTLASLQAGGTSAVLGANGRDYDFTLDLSKIESAIELNTIRPQTFDDGEWQLQILIRKSGQWYGTALLDPYGEPVGRFVLDSQAPTVTIEYFKSNGTPLVAGEYTREPVSVRINCQDDLSGCSDGQTMVFPDYAVKGNFCGNTDDCNSTGVRQLSICDKAGNCAEPNINIDQYDPIPPRINQAELGFGAYRGNRVRAESDFDLSINFTDPTRIQTVGSGSGTLNNETLRLSTAEYSNLFDENACGTGSTPLQIINNACREIGATCVASGSNYTRRGETDASQNCVASCPVGYSTVGGRCQRDCNTSVFDPVYMCFDFELHDACTTYETYALYDDANGDGIVVEADLIGDLSPFSGPISGADNYNYYSASAHPVYGPSTVQGYLNAYMYEGSDGASLLFFSDKDNSGAGRGNFRAELTISNNAQQDRVIVSDDRNEMRLTGTSGGQNQYEGAFGYVRNSDGAGVGPLGDTFLMKGRFNGFASQNPRAVHFYSVNGDRFELRQNQRFVLKKVSRTECVN